MTPSTNHTHASFRPTFLSSLRVHLILMVLLAVLPALILVIHNAIELRKIGLSVAEDKAFRIAHLAGSRQDERIESARQLLLILSQIRDLKNLKPEGTQFILSNILLVNPIFHNLMLFTADGTLVASSIYSTNLLNLGQKAFFHNVLNDEQFTIGEYHVVPNTTKAMLVVANPVFNEQDALAGVVMAELNLDWIYTLYEESQLPPGASFTIYDKYYITLARRPDPDNIYVGQRIGRSTTNNASTTPDTNTEITNRNEVRTGDHATVIQGRDGIERRYASSRLGQTMGTNSVRVTFGIPLAVAHADSNRLLLRNLMLLGAATLLALLAAWYGGNYFVLRRVRSLLTATRNLQEGDLSARADQVSGGGELDHLARTFNEMAQELETEFTNRHQAQQDLKVLNQDLEKRVEARTHDLKRSNEDLQQFAYVASHDLKEPLRMISSYLELLQKRYQDKLDKDASEFIGYAVDGSQRMHRLINDLLAYSRLETKAKPFEEISLDQILDQVLANLQVSINENQATFHRPTLPKLQADPSQISQLLQNLLANAIKFKGEIAPEIFITAEEEKNQWLFSVRDNGIGISKEHYQRIFVIFQRLHTRQQYPGTGIGLSICKKIVERHGGRIWVESTPGTGTTVRFTLPKKQPRPSES